VLPSPGRTRPDRARRPTRSIVLATLLAAVVLAGCAATTDFGVPAPTPTDIRGVVEALRVRGVTATGIVSGDAGCADPTLIAAAIAFDVAGLDQATPIPVRLYIFNDDEAYQRDRPAVDACAASWLTDPATYEVVDASPFALAGQGPWPTKLHDALRAGIEAAATGG